MFIIVSLNLKNLLLAKIEGIKNIRLQSLQIYQFKS